MTGRSTKGRAPSCTSTVRHAGSSAARPAATESVRSAPPATMASPAPATSRRKSGGCAASSGGQHERDLGDVGMDANGRSARSTIGTPAMGRYCFGRLAADPRPAARGDDDDSDVTRQAPAPAARRGRARPSNAGDLGAAAGRPEHPAEAEARRPPRCGARSLRSGGSRRPARSRRGRSTSRGAGRLYRLEIERGGDREVGTRLAQPHAGRDLHEDVQIGERGVGPPLEHRQQHREALGIETGGHPLRRAVARLGGERLDFDQHRPGAFHERGHRAAADPRRPARRETPPTDSAPATSPCSVMEKTPSSSTEPNRFLVVRSSR